jgi:glycerol-3-phosphate dehydrogenase (NAD(P)+)
MEDTPSAATLAVVGAGAWGTTIAALLGAGGHDVRLWARDPAHARALRQARVNRRYLPELTLPPTVAATSDLAAAVRGAHVVFVAVPSHALREVMAALPPVPALVNCAKGLELATFKRYSSVMAEYQPAAALAALSGPNLAFEIARGLPAAATVASHDDTLARTVQRYLNGPSFRVYTSRDLVGVEIGGAVKNVIALAAGMCDGLGLGDNAKAGIITRGLSELVRLGTHLGAEARTLYGLAGLGDMVATCSSPHSRNHTAGRRLAQGASLADLEASRLTTEGIPTTRAVVAYARAHGLELPIAEAVHRVIFAGLSPQEALKGLMAREHKPED